ncbi:dephospho-CoA kinase [Agarivorans aestuarii]|uniref:Dephospho-CoA kinase n=1 Tax=Agarivorans aestuarii TaxID=1563703 RepID=A0ABU7G8A8_9ALTE|nr:dephospho-CoA kinase [Agarivorans aestuarii]MEE1675476.1 dephospho-CoA kinase [Agarivorans aestuarii]
MIVGLTGGIASGKSQVSQLFEEFGIEIVDADIVARQVVEPNQPALAKISEHFGKTILLADGSLNRSKLREIVFAQRHQKEWLNALLHPLIRQEMLRQLEQAKGAYKILVAPLLLENKLNQLVDRVLVIDTPIDIQLSRTMARDGVDKQQAQQIVDAQMSRKLKLQAADDVIENNSDLNSLKRKVADLHQFYLDITKSHDS